MGSKALKGAAALAAFVILQAGAPATGFAGGVIKYKVSVKNDTPDSTCMVDLYYGDPSANLKHTYTIAPGAEHTFTVDGPQCTRQLAGRCMVTYVDHTTYMYSRCISGDKEESSDCPPACWSSDWAIRLQPTDRPGISAIHFFKR